MCLSVHPSIYLYICLSVHQFAHLYVCLSPHQSIRPSTYMSVCLSIRSSIHRSVCLSDRIVKIFKNNVKICDNVFSVFNPKAHCSLCGKESPVGGVGLNTWVCVLFTGSHITLQPKTGCPLKLSRVEPSQLLLEEVLVRPAGGAHPVVCVGSNAPV